MLFLRWLIHTMCALRIHVRLIKRPLNSNTHTALELSAWVLAVFIALCVCYINKETQQKNREFFVHIFFLSYFVPSTFAMHSRGLYNHRRIAQNNPHNFQFIIFHFYLFLAKTATRLQTINNRTKLQVALAATPTTRLPCNQMSLVIQFNSMLLLFFHTVFFLLSLRAAHINSLLSILSLEKKSRRIDCALRSGRKMVTFLIA